MSYFRKKPVVIEAIPASEVLDGATKGRFSVKSVSPIVPWIVEAFEKAVIGFEGTDVVLINTEGHGQVRAERTDWIIKGVNGEIYPCRPDVFEKTYDAADGQTIHTVEQQMIYSAKQEQIDTRHVSLNADGSLDFSGVVKLNGSVGAEQFAEFKKKWLAEHAALVKTHSLDVSSDKDGAAIGDDLLDFAWGLIANASGGDWAKQTKEWQDAAARWRDEYVKPATRVASQFLDTSNDKDSAAIGSKEIVDQPPPVKRDDLVPTWEQVIVDFRKQYEGSGLSGVADNTFSDVVTDMEERDKVGRARYGVPLTAHNGRDQLVDAYQEALDLAVYLRAAIEEGNDISATASDTYRMTLASVMALRLSINSRNTKKSETTP